MPSSVFDHRRLRLLIGIIAFLLPLVVDIVAADELVSISASYHTEARDVFVGLLFVIAALMASYRGHSRIESVASRAAAAATVCIALFPAAGPTTQSGWESHFHDLCALVLFSILAYFCLGPFRRRTQGHSGKKGRRARIYLVCGCIILAVMLGLGTATWALPEDTVGAYEMTYWAELVALWAFGTAWITAGKVLPFLVDADEAWYPSSGSILLERRRIAPNYTSS